VSFFPVFSPKSAALMTVQSIAYERTMVTSPSTTFDSTFSDLGNILEPLRSSWNSFESVIIVKDLSWCGIEDLQKVLPSFKTIFKFDNATYRLNDGPFYEDMPGFNPIVKTTPAVKALKIQTSWDTAVNRLLENEQEHAMPSISMVCGTKNVGKSTFGRYLVNRLLNVHQRVAYLETDIGQTEFTPSGMVSFHILDTPLLGPPFSHPHLKCKRSFFVGSTSPKNDATYYLDCIQQLVQTYRQESEAWVAIAEQDGDNSQRQLLPLVVNIHGYVKGAGYDMLMTMMKDIMPTHVFAFVNSPGVSNNTFNLPPDFTNNVMMMQESLPNRHLIHLQIPTNPTSTTTISDQGQSLLPTRPQQWKAPPTTWADKYQPIDHRQFMLIWWHTSTRLVERIPWTIDWRTHLKGIWVLFDDVPVSQLLYALNGSLVVGLIRSIDPENHRFYILTPLSIERLQLVTGLVKGDLELPLNCMFDKRDEYGNGVCDSPWRQVPYLSLDVVETAGSAAPRLRRNIMRKSQQME
ncbi:uncharacterized protein BX664DRAFT_268941, partial [Halteromyces radiatus]|uniref:uncharacterized protein n=1 Tax=Halteromyces radiatus TaxID=101107 RepID=UPI0022204691